MAGAVFWSVPAPWKQKLRRFLFEILCRTCQIMKGFRNLQNVVKTYLVAGCEFLPNLWAESLDLNPVCTNGFESYHGRLMPTSILLSQTSGYYVQTLGYCDHRYALTLLWRHLRSHGQFAKTAERSLHDCDACTRRISVQKQYLELVSCRFCPAWIS